MGQIKDRDVQKALKEMVKLKDGWERYEELQLRVKESLRRLEPGDYETEDWKITVSTSTKTEYLAPDDVVSKKHKLEAQIAKLMKPFAHKVPGTLRISLDVKE